MTRYCSACGTPNDDVLVNCANCGQPLPLLPGPPDASTPAAQLAGADKTKTAYGWRDVTFIAKRFPFESTRKLGPMQANVLRDNAVKAIASMGFGVISNVEPYFYSRPATGKPADRHLRMVVGERGLRPDIVRSAKKKSLITKEVVALVVLWALAFISLILLSNFGLFMLLYFPGMIVFVIIAMSAASISSFDSDIVFVQFAPGSRTTKTDWEGGAPMVFDVRVAAGSIASRNHRAKHSHWREMDSLLPPRPDLAGLVDELSRRL